MGELISAARFQEPPIDPLSAPRRRLARDDRLLRQCLFVIRIEDAKRLAGEPEEPFARTLGVPKMLGDQEVVFAIQAQPRIRHHCAG